MIQRRTFLGLASGAAFCLATRGVCAANPTTRSLPWTSTVIQTVRHGQLARKPVVTGISLQSKGPLLAIVGDDHYVSLFDTDAKKFIKHLKHHSDWVRDAKFSPDSTMLYTCGNDHHLIGWKAEDFSRPAFKIRRKDAIIKLAISHDSKQVATVGFNRNLIIHDAIMGTEIHQLRCSCDDNHAVAFSTDDKLIAAGGRSGMIHVWDAEKYTKLHEIKAHRRRVRSLEFTESGDLVSAGDDQIVKINKLSNPSASFALPRHAAKLFAVKVMSPSVIATSGSDNKIHVWNLTNISEIGLLDRHTGTVSSLDMAQDVLVSGSFDTTVRIWTPDPNELARAEPVFISPDAAKNPTVIRSATPGNWTRR